MQHNNHMNVALVQIGKCLTIILYWGITIALSYICYDEYLTEHRWTSLCELITFLSLGVGLHGVFLNWIYNAEIQTFATKHQKLYSIIKTIAIWGSGILIGISLLFLFASIFGPLILELSTGMIIVIRSTWIYWVVVLSILVCYWGLRIPRKSLVLKTFAKITYRIFLLGFIALIVYCEILIFKAVLRENVVGEDAIIAGGVFLLLIFGVISYLLYMSCIKGIISFASMRYVLLLRAFKDDDICKTIYLSLKNTTRIPIKLIGNPSEYDTWFKVESTDEFTEIDKHWLPSDNWKSFLRFYIARAKAIVLLAGATDGVVWEALENVKHLNKCVISFISTLELENFKTKLQTLQNPDIHPLIYVIDKVLTLNPDFNAFVLRGNKIYIDNVDVLTNQLLKNKLETVNYIIELDTNKVNSKNSLWMRILGKVYRSLHILNIINTFESVQNNFIRGVLGSIGAIVAIVFYLSAIAIGILLLVGPIFIWIAPEFDNDGIVIKIIGSIFFITFGRYILKSLKD